MARGDDARAKRDVFEAEALPHLDHLYGAASYLCVDPDRAADLVQETMLRALRFFHQFEPGTNCRAWLLTILHNTFRNQYRASRPERGQVDIDEPGPAHEATEAALSETNPETIVLSEMMDQEIVDALRELPEEFRSAIVLVDLQELTYEEAARALGCPVGTVRSRLSRGRRLLERKLAGYARARGLRRGGT
jgi:RNA polymerase sigma-70 factor (ECF subfamily)